MNSCRHERKSNLTVPPNSINSLALLKLVLFLLFVSHYILTVGSYQKIIGGRRASLGEFPYIVCLYGILRCGGTLVTLDKVVTAGHCFFIKEKRISPVDVVVIGDTVDLNEESGNMQVAHLIDYIIHDKFKRREFALGIYIFNDIGLAFLHTAFIETSTLKPAIFPSNNAVGMKKFMDELKASDPNCHATGFGVISPNLKAISQYLKVVDLKLLPDSIYDGLPQLIGYEICAISEKDYDETSFGDSGSTFLCDGNIVGFTKGGLPAQVEGKNITIMVFTLVGPYLEDFMHAGSDGMPNSQFLPAILLCFLFMPFTFQESDTFLIP